MKHRLGLAILAACIATITAALPAAAVPEGPLTVTTSSMTIGTTTSCATFPITWYLKSAPIDVSTWAIDGDIVDSAGASRGSIFEYESLPVTQATSSYTVCNLPEGPSTFTVAADVDAWSSSFYSHYAIKGSTTLTITRTTPPPPPPVIINTQMVIDGKPTWFERRTYARIGALLEFRGACASGARDVTMTGRKASGGWRKLASWTVDETAYLKAKVPYSFRKVRFETTATSVCTADTTLPVKVPSRR